MLNIPAGKKQNGRMALQGTCQYLHPPHPQSNPVSFNRGNRRLRKPGHLRQLILAERLQITEDAYGFTNRYIDSLSWLFDTRSSHIFG